MDLSSVGAPSSTSTPPAASATRCRWWSRRSWRRSASPSRSCPAAASATPAAPSTSSSRSRAGPARSAGEQFLAQLRDVGAVIAAATEDLAPADKALYALRDVTATVESLPLIASSIMSKKIAGGADAVLLDVKVGAGAFMPTVEAARALAETMVGLGAAHGVRTVALLTSMESPLGRGVGNASRWPRPWRCSRAAGPTTWSRCAWPWPRRCSPSAAARTPTRPRRSRDGTALDVWRRMVRAQGGDPDAPLPRAPHVEVLTAPRDGVLGRLDARAVGTAAWLLGAGRARKEDAVSAAAGVRCLVRPGEAVRAGDPLLELHADDAARLADGAAALQGSYDVVDEAGPRVPLVLEKVGNGSA
jgi:thymidine phosphorylase